MVVAEGPKTQFFFRDNQRLLKITRITRDYKGISLRLPEITMKYRCTKLHHVSYPLEEGMVEKMSIKANNIHIRNTCS